MPASERRLPPAKQGSKILLTETLRKKESTKLREWCTKFNIKTGNTSRECLAAGVSGWVLEREVKNEQEVLAHFLRALRQRKPSTGRGRH